MKRLIPAAAGLAALGIGIGVIAVSQTASAHIPRYEVNCNGITAHGTAYGAGATMTVVVNGETTVQTVNNGGNFPAVHRPFNATGDNVWSVTWDDADNRYDSSVSGTTEGCGGPTTTEPPVETTEPPVETTEPPVETTEPPTETTEPIDTTPDTEPPVDTTEPPVDTTEPPATEPPATDPPSTDPLASEPPTTPEPSEPVPPVVTDPPPVTTTPPVAPTPAVPPSGVLPETR